MKGLGADVRIAIRRLRSAPAFTAFAIATLALAVGATTAIYSVIYAAVLRPPDIRDVDRVANLYHMDPRRGGSGPMILLSLPDFQDYAAAQTRFAHLTTWARFRKAIVAPGLAEVVMGEMVGGDYFAVVGIERAALGRLIQPADDRRDAPRVIVLSDLPWKRRFGGDPNVVGRRITVGGEPFEIIGVAPPQFRGVDMPNVTPPRWLGCRSHRCRRSVPAPIVDRGGCSSRVGSSQAPPWTRRRQKRERSRGSSTRPIRSERTCGPVGERPT